MLILTNSNPQSIDVMLCLYKEWHKLQIQIKGIFSQDTTSCIPAFPFDPPTQSDTCISCYMGTRDLPDMYAQSPIGPLGPRAYISGKSRVPYYVTLLTL